MPLRAASGELRFEAICKCLQRRRNDRLGACEGLDEIRCKLLLIWGDKGNGSPLLLRTSGAANTVNVILNMIRRVVVDLCSV